VDEQTPLVLWERPPVVCFFITRAVEPRYEIQLHINGILLASRWFSEEAEAVMYALLQKGVYR
jgi:hypothetical protein